MYFVITLNLVQFLTYFNDNIIITYKRITVVDNIWMEVSANNIAIAQY